MMHRHAKRIDAYLDGELGAQQSAALEGHVRCCADCRVMLEDRRRLKRRLQALNSAAHPVGAPDDALLGRLRESPWQSSPHNGFAGAALDNEGHCSRLRAMAPTLASAAVLAMLATVICAAWMLGASPTDEPSAAGAATGTWSESGTELTSADLGRLRSAGWNCPTLTAADLVLVRATGQRVDGADQVTLEFSGQRGTVVLTEARTPDPSLLHAAVSPPEIGATRSGPQTVGAVTPRLRTIDGETVRVATAARGIQLAMQTATYTVQSSLDSTQTESVLNRVAATEHARLAPRTQDHDDTWNRLGRGISRLLVLDTDH